MAKHLTSGKAKEILRDGTVHGHAITARQRRFFGAIAGGQKPRRVKGAGHQGSPFEFASTPSYKATGKFGILN